MIDWNKPIETVPCARNPLPVPCSTVAEGIDIVLGTLAKAKAPHHVQ
jgi:hypothetical protein